MKNPKAIIEVTPEGIKVTLENWAGVNATRIAHIQDEIVKADHRNRAAGLQAMRAQDMKDNAKKEIDHVAAP